MIHVLIVKSMLKYADKSEEEIFGEPANKDSSRLIRNIRRDEQYGIKRKIRNVR